MRQTRSQAADLVAESLKELSLKINTEAKLEAALTLAQEALEEQPKILTDCELSIEAIPFRSETDRAHCSECDGAFLGWTETWRFCPLCSSQVVSVKRENDPAERQIRESVEKILKG